MLWLRHGVSSWAQGVVNVSRRSFIVGAAIAFVALESLAGAWCPLTVWEDALRGAASDKSFIARWVHRLMFFQLPEWVFTVAYVLFAAVVVLTFAFVPPEKCRIKSATSSH